MKTKPRREVACRDRLREQHEHQSQGRGIVHRQTHRGGVLCTDRVTAEGYGVQTDSQGRVLCTDRLTGEGYCVQTDSQGRAIVYRQNHRGGVLYTERLTWGGVVCTGRLTGERL